MTDFYMNYLDLCKEKDLQPVSDKAAELWGVSKAAISGWKNKDSMPSSDAMVEMMKYFGVSVPVLENRKLFLENHACYIIVEGRVNGKLSVQSCYDIFHTSDDVLGYNIRNLMLGLDPECTIFLRPATDEEVAEYTAPVEEDEISLESRYKTVSQAEAHRIFREKISHSYGV